MLDVSSTLDLGGFLQVHDELGKRSHHLVSIELCVLIIPVCYILI